MLKNLVELTKKTRLWASGSHSLSGSAVWNIATVAIALLVAIPIFTVISNIFVPSGDIWGHLASTVLPLYIMNSFWLMIGVGTGVFLIGVGTAWLVTMCSFPGSKQFQWLLILPMAVPAYLLAYTYTDFLAFTGPVQDTIRAVTGWGYGDYWFPDIRSLWGAVLLMSLVFFPYVYLLTRAAFLEQSASLLEASRSLGASSTTSFFKIALPLARPSIAAGMALALMETLNDFGTVDYFGVQTFTTGIYRTWFGLGERVAAAQLSAFLMLFILVLILVERWSRNKMDFQQGGASRFRFISQYEIKDWKKWGSMIACAIPVLAGFFIPLLILVDMFLENMGAALDARFIQYAFNTFLVAILSGFIALFIS